MKLPGNSFNVGLRLTLTFAALLGLILAGNGLLVWQFRLAGMQTERLTGANQQVIAVLRIQEELLAFHQRLTELVETRDASRFVSQVQPLRKTLVMQIAQAKTTVINLPYGTHVDPASLGTLDAIAVDLTAQIDAVTALAQLGAWDVAGARLTKFLRVMEDQIAILVKSIDRESNIELTNTTINMRELQRRIFTIVPVMALSTFSIAVFFAWAIIRRIVELRLEERVSERMRLACEIHDNLLQWILSARMLLHVVVNQAPANSTALPKLKRISQVMDQAIEEGRSTIRGFRLNAGGDVDLACAFSAVQEELRLEKTIACRVQVKGAPRALRPLIRNDVYSIGREALVNAFRHSGANSIELELEYATQLRILVRDDGCGIDDVLLRNGRDGHFGLSTMRERAERIGGRLRVSNKTGCGTEVELHVPGRIAFDPQRGISSFGWLAALRPQGDTRSRRVTE